MVQGCAQFPLNPLGPLAIVPSNGCRAPSSFSSSILNLCPISPPRRGLWCLREGETQEPLEAV